MSDKPGWTAGMWATAILIAMGGAIVSRLIVLFGGDPWWCGCGYGSWCALIVAIFNRRAALRLARGEGDADV